MAEAILAQSGIYAITNTANGKKYIGSACYLGSRFRTHRARLNLKKHHSIKLQNAWNKYGKDAFLFSVIEYVEDKSCLIGREQHWIDTFASAGAAGYNVCAIAGSCLGFRHTAETKAKVSAAGKGRKRTAEMIAKVVAANTGRKNTPESIARMIGQVFTAERRANISAAKKGRPQDPAKIALRSGRKFSAEHIANLSRASAGRRPSAEALAKRHATRMANGGYIQTAESIAKRQATRAANKAANLQQI